MLGRWQDPPRRIDRYLVVIAYRFHFDPRVIDEWTIFEFDQFADYCDEFARQERKATAQSGRR